MPHIQHFFFVLLILALLGLTIVSASSSQDLRKGAVADAIAREKLRFQELLNSVEPSSLHDVMHQHMKDKYKHGVYQEDKHAMEVVHQENAEVALSLIELAKRQAGNGTATTVVTTTAATTTETTTTDIGTQTDTGGTAATSENSQPPPTTQQPSQASPTATGGSTDTQSQQLSPVSSSVQSTYSKPSSSTNVKSTSSSDKDSTSATPSRSVTQQILYTTTLANGAVTTVTSITVVPAEVAQTADGNSGTSTKTANASLQTNSATSGKNLGINCVFGALCLVVVVGGL